MWVEANYTTVYSRCCYARADDTVTKQLVAECDKEGTFNCNNNSDHALADHFADSGDPREHIIRRDLEHRGKDSSDYHTNINKFKGTYPELEYKGSDWYTIGEDQHLGIVKEFNNATGTHYNDLVLEYVTKDDKGENKTNSYRASFTATEAEPIIEALRQHGFLDHPFNPKWS